MRSSSAAEGLGVRTLCKNSVRIMNAAVCAARAWTWGCRRGRMFGVGIAKFPTAFTGRSRCDFVAQAAAGVDHKDVQEEGACGDSGGAGDDRSELGR